MLNDIPPWDQLPYYAVPTETVQGLGITPAKILSGDPMRARIVFALNNTNAAGKNAIVSTSPDTLSNGGIVIQTNEPVLIVTWEDWGPLVSQPWFAIVSGAGAPPSPFLTIQTVSFIRWPGKIGSPSLLEQSNGRSNGYPPIAYPPGRQNGNGRNYQYGNSRHQPPAYSDSDISAIIESCQRGYKRSGNGNNWLAPHRWGIPSSPG